MVEITEINTIINPITRAHEYLQVVANLEVKSKKSKLYIAKTTAQEALNENDPKVLSSSLEKVTKYLTGWNKPAEVSKYVRCEIAYLVDIVSKYVEPVRETKVPISNDKPDINGIITKMPTKEVKSNKEPDWAIKFKDNGIGMTSDFIPEITEERYVDKWFYELRNNEVLAEHKSDVVPWPGKQKNVNYWIELKRGWAVGINEGTRGSNVVVASFSYTRSLMELPEEVSGMHAISTLLNTSCICGNTTNIQVFDFKLNKYVPYCTVCQSVVS